MFRPPHPVRRSDVFRWRAALPVIQCLALDGSSLTAGDIGTGNFSSTSIQNGSAVAVNRVGNLGDFAVDGTSSLAVSGDFFNYRERHGRDRWSIRRKGDFA